ncbi:MAG: hypothetical protein U0487_01570 [Patescibacteria group bacterium]
MDDAQLLHLATFLVIACKAQQDAGVLERRVRYSDFAMAKALQREHQRGTPCSPPCRMMQGRPNASPAFSSKRCNSFQCRTVLPTNADKTHFIVEISSRQMNEYVLDKDFSNALVLVTEYRYQVQRTTRND